MKKIIRYIIPALSVFILCLLSCSIIGASIVTGLICAIVFAAITATGILFQERIKNKKGKIRYIIGIITAIVFSVGAALFSVDAGYRILLAFLSVLLGWGITLSLEKSKNKTIWFITWFFPNLFFFLLNASCLWLGFVPRIILPGHPSAFSLMYIVGYLIVLGLFTGLRAVLDKIGIIVASIGFTAVILTNYIVNKIVSKPFVPTDVFSAGTAFSVLGEQTITPGIWIAGIASVIFLAGLIFVLFCRKNRTKYNAVLGIVGLIPLAVSLGLVFFIRPFSESMLMYDGQYNYGYVAYFCMSSNTGLDFSQDIENYLPEKDEDVSGKKPDVIVIMSEAYSNIQQLYDLGGETANKEFLKLCEDFPSGTAYSSVLGNNTTSSELEFLMGIPTGLTTKGALIMTNNCKYPQNSLVSLFKARGYTTIGFHPYYAAGYNRNNYYNTALQFDKSIFIEDTGVLPTYNGFTTDAADYDYLIRLYEKEKKTSNKPVFLFNVTVQNHAGYSSDGGLEDKITTNPRYPQVNNYLTLIHESDKQLHLLTDYFEKQDTDVVLLIFGDHQPLTDAEFKADYYREETLAEMSKRYEIPYLIWANYPLKKTDYGKIGLSYLSNILFEAAGIEKSSWQKKTDLYMAEWPAVTDNFFLSKDGKFYNTKEVSDSVLENYKNYSYGILYGDRKENK